ncbi:MAG: hypothetical protein OXI01_22165 [Albidovulum sp.]|nr:hypothetical protein [Albidovulum sp.]
MQGVEKRQQLVVGPVDSFGDNNRPGLIHRPFLDLHIGVQVDSRGFCGLMVKPQGDHGAADPAAEQLYGGGVELRRDDGGRGRKAGLGDLRPVLRI